MADFTSPEATATRAALQAYPFLEGMVPYPSGTPNTPISPEDFIRGKMSPYGIEPTFQGDLTKLFRGENLLNNRGVETYWGLDPGTSNFFALPNLDPDIAPHTSATSYTGVIPTSEAARAVNVIPAMPGLSDVPTISEITVSPESSELIKSGRGASATAEALSENVKALEAGIPGTGTDPNPFLKAGRGFLKTLGRVTPWANVAGGALASYDYGQKDQNVREGLAALSTVPYLGTIPFAAETAINVGERLLGDPAMAADVAMPGSTYVPDPNYDAQAIQSELIQQGTTSSGSDQATPVFQQGTESLLPTALGVNERDYRSQIYEALSGMRTGREELAELEEMGSTTPGIRRNLVNWVTGKVEDIGDLPFVPQLIDRDQFLPQTPGMFEPTEEDWTWNDSRLGPTLIAHKAYQAGDRLLNAALGKIGIDRTKVHRAENTKIAEDLGEAKFGRPLSNSEMDALLHIAGGTTPIAKNVMGLYSAFDKDDPLSALQDAVNDMVVNSEVNKGKTIEELFDDPNVITGGEDNLQWSDIRNLGRSMSLDVPMEEGWTDPTVYGVPQLGIPTEVGSMTQIEPQSRAGLPWDYAIDVRNQQPVERIVEGLRGMAPRIPPPPEPQPEPARESSKDREARESREAASRAVKIHEATVSRIKEESKKAGEKKLQADDKKAIARANAAAERAQKKSDDLIKKQMDDMMKAAERQRNAERVLSTFVDPWAFEDRRGGRR